MGCGEDLACQLFDWLVNNGYVVKQAFDALDVIWKETGWHIGEFLKEHGEKLVTLASFSFAVWRWWIYRERTLHKRLEEYIRDSDIRLKPASEQVVDVLLRPGRTAALPQPVFAIELRDILSTHGWRSYFRISTVERQAERQLGRALRGISKRERIVREASLSLQEQRAQAHLIAGAVAASRARRKPDRNAASRDDHRALREFQEVLQSPAHHHNVNAKDCEAFQFLRLGERDLAFQAYVDLEDFAGNLADAKTRDLIIARSRRFRAQILQAIAGDNASLAAWGLVGQANEGSALQLRAHHAPYSEWTAIEQAEMHYVAAYIASKFNNWVNHQPTNLSNAENAYKTVLDELPARRYFVAAADRRLRDEAQAGLERVKRVKANSDDYDAEWLMI
jgi:hypothetical protein